MAKTSSQYGTNRWWIRQLRHKIARHSSRTGRQISGVVRRTPLWVAVVVAVIGAVGIAFVAYLLLHQLLPAGNDRIQPKDLTQFALTIVAGIGGVVALVVAYRRQQGIEQSRFIERFGAAASQLGHSDVAVRLAGVYAMAGVADEAPMLQRQQCVDVLCGYLRRPYSPALGDSHQSELHRKVPGREGEETTHLFQYRQNDKEVRNAIMSVISSHVRNDASESWSRCSFDFQGAVLENVDFTDARFAGRRTSFAGATFGGDQTMFEGARFSGKHTIFDGARFIGETWFSWTTFGAEFTWFIKTTFSGDGTWFDGVTFSGDRVSFNEATFCGNWVSFSSATFSGDETWFGAKFGGEGVSFSGATFCGRFTSFASATFSGKMTTFQQTNFLGTTVFEKSQKRNTSLMFDWDDDLPSSERNPKPGTVILRDQRPQEGG